ncbi:hypothetical protein Javan258_0026 [Streptococcus phage Javan258]|nr:hypothetical protein Javan258_0026 [Streptococcus phage Javan258]
MIEDAQVQILTLALHLCPLIGAFFVPKIQNNGKTSPF